MRDALVEQAQRPDPRTVEDLIARGQMSLVRSARDADAETLRAIEQAATWLYQVARELRR